MSIASQPDERADAIEVYLGYQGEGTLALALRPGHGPDDARRAGTVLQRVTSSVLRGGLTSWVHVGMLVRRMRGRADPLQGVGQRETFLALCRLTQAAVEAEPVRGPVPGGLDVANHVRLFTTPLDADSTIERIQQVLGPYAAAGTVTRTGRAVIAWFAIRHLIATRSRDYSLQVVHFSEDSGRGGQVSLMLPRDLNETPAPDGRTIAVHEPTPARPTRRRRFRRARDTRADASGGPVESGPALDTAGLQAYLDTYREYLTRELLLEPIIPTNSETEFAWMPEPTGDGGVAVAGTVPGAVADHIVLRMADYAVIRLSERFPDYAGSRLGGLESDGELLFLRWSVGAQAGYVLSVAARTGDRRRPTQVLIHFASAAGSASGHDGGWPAEAPELPPPAHQPPKTGPAAAEAATLTNLPLWWHDAHARCDGNDVVLYEMPFRGQRLRVRANDYPAEPMYTLLVGEPGEEVAAVDLEHWPSSWIRPRSS